MSGLDSVFGGIYATGRTSVVLKRDAHIQRDRDGGVVSALRESAFVTEIRLEKENLRIMGLAEDAPGLLAPLERSKHMTDVRFFAPTARGPDGKRFRFSIEARVQPHIKIGED